MTYLGSGIIGPGATHRLTSRMHLLSQAGSFSSRTHRKHFDCSISHATYLVSPYRSWLRSWLPSVPPVTSSTSRPTRRLGSSRLIYPASHRTRITTAPSVIVLILIIATLEKVAPMQVATTIFTMTSVLLAMSLSCPTYRPVSPQALCAIHHSTYHHHHHHHHQLRYLRPP